MKKYLTAMGLLGLVEIGLALGLTFWSELFWNDVSTRNLHGFEKQLIIFTVIACLLCLVSSIATYMGNLAAIEWRKALIIRMNTVTMIVFASSAENFSQRMQQDTLEYPQLIINIAYGVIKSVVYIIGFSVVLVWGFGINYLLIITTYAIISTLIAKKVAKPLIELNYQQQRAEATYRSELSFINFEDCILLMFGIASKTKRLNYFQTFYAQLGVIIPIVIIAPAYFSTALTLGALMQGTRLMGTILENLSFGISSFGEINKLLSCRKRLKEINIL